MNPCRFAPTDWDRPRSLGVLSLCKPRLLTGLSRQRLDNAPTTMVRPIMTQHSPNEPPSARVVTPRKHEEIAESLTQDILVGQYRTGERLPSERDLAARFDVNRGAVREAMKKLEQLGLASIHQGGARACAVQDASLDVIGHLLAMGDVPNEDLVDEIMQVFTALITLAAEATVRRATDTQIGAIRERLQPLLRGTSNRTANSIARFELMRSIMQTSGNLVCQIIARSLFLQFVPRMAPLESLVELDLAAQRAFAEQLDAALAARNVEGVRSAFESMSNFNREVAKRAFAALKAQGSESVSRIWSHVP
jgi:GntR family transcriptional repressor for pyruvate dehydrogenase complex